MLKSTSAERCAKETLETCEVYLSNAVCREIARTLTVGRHCDDSLLPVDFC